MIVSNRWFPLVCIAAMIAASVIAYGRLPEQVPSHWNIEGEVDDYMSRELTVLLLPAISLGLWGLLAGLPRIDPRRASYDLFRGSYRRVINTLMLFMAVIHVAVLLSVEHESVVPRVIAIAMGYMLMALGNELGRFRPNYFAGIRTPWTLSDDEVWRQTHRLGGRVFFACGLLTFVAAMVLPVEAVFYVLLGTLLPGTVAVVAYSYFVWRRRHGPAQPTAG